MREVWKTLLLTAGTLALASCSAMLPHDSKVSSATFLTYDQVLTAYSAVVPGKTRTPDLSAIGFDASAASNVEHLTYAGVSERFVLEAGAPGVPPAHVPVQVQACIAATERCAAFVYHLQHTERHHVGNALLDLAEFERNVVETGWSAEVMLVLQDGVVVYKIMSGRPQIETARDSVKPLGPLQNIGGLVPGAPTSPDKKEKQDQKKP